LGYELSREDPDVWFHAVTKETKEECYEYSFLYTDDILAIVVDPNHVLTHLNKYFALKPDYIHPPDDYLGTKLKETVLSNGVKTWGKSSSHNIHNEAANLESWMRNHEKH
jgi:hypothetical protein